jgi:Putative peptidoglycan binding domain
MRTKIIFGGAGALVLMMPFLVSASICPDLTRTLSYSSRGQDVVELQNYLIGKNLLAQGNATGYFGRLTESAVQSFQRQHDVVSSGSPTATGYGVVGPATRRAIAAQCTTSQEQVSQIASDTARVAPQTGTTVLSRSEVSSSDTATQQTATAPLLLTTKTITTTHRYDAGKMFGGWGPHLGHLLRDSTGALWLADDTGNDVNSNPQINYYKYSPSLQSWSLDGSNVLYGTVQQNTGPLMSNTDMIFSYGIDIAHSLLEECYYYTKQSYKACNSITQIPVGTNANYVGAALSPSGTTRVVWWTNVSDNGSGKFSYIFNTNNGGWNGPFVLTLPGYNDLAYVTVAFVGENKLKYLGQVVTGTAPNWSYNALYGTISLGSAPIILNTLQGLAPAVQTSSNDIYVDAQGGTHLLYRSFGSTVDLVYAYVTPTGQITAPALVDAKTSYARFVVTSSALYLIGAPSTGGLKIRSVDLATVSGAINWPAVQAQTFLTEPFDAIYPESRMYQYSAIPVLSFAVNPVARQNEVIHVTTQSNTTPVVQCIAATPSLQTQTLSCPTGQTGSITQTRSSLCATGATSPSWSVWTTTSNTCTTSQTQDNPVTLTSSVSGVSSGGNATLSLSTSQQSSCTISGGIYGNGQQTQLPTWSGWTGALTQSTTFTASCKNAGGQSTNSSATVTVSSASNVSCTPEPSSPQSQTLSCPTGQTGSITQSRTSTCVAGATSPTWGAWTTTTNTCFVSALPVSGSAGPVTFSGQPGKVSVGQSATLSLSASNVALCTIAGGIYGSGQQTLIPTWSGWTGNLTQNTTFTIKCTGIGGENYSVPITVSIF